MIPAVRMMLFLLASVESIPAQNLPAVLARMNAAASGFRSISADFARVTYTAVIDDTGEEAGAFKMIRPRPNEARVLIELVKPDPRLVAIGNRKAEVFNPKIMTVEEYDLGKHKSYVDQFLLLGFGTPASELQRSYSIRYVGEEIVAGVSCSKLEMVPKSADFLKAFRRIDLWIGPSGYPVRQKFNAPSGNHSMITYTAAKLNGDLRADQLALKLPPGVKRIFPGK